jgi:hypothetical protein
LNFDPNSTLLGLDDADEDQRGLMVVSIHRKSEHFGWQLGQIGIEELKHQGSFTKKFWGIKHEKTGESNWRGS